MTTILPDDPSDPNAPAGYPSYEQPGQNQSGQGQPGQNQSQYGQPGYGYPQSAYPHHAYPHHAYPQYAYPQYGGYQPYGVPAAPYQPYGYAPQGPGGYPPYPGYPPFPGAGYFPPQTDPAGRRPGMVTAGAVMGFIVGGILLLSALGVLASTAGTDSSDQTFGTDRFFSGSELITDGVLNILAAALLISGAVALIGGRVPARVLYSTGTVLTVGLGVYWMVRGSQPGLITSSLIFYVAPVVLGVIFIWVPTSSAWFARKAEVADRQRR